MLVIIKLEFVNLQLFFLCLYTTIIIAGIEFSECTYRNVFPQFNDTKISIIVFSSEMPKIRAKKKQSCVILFLEPFEAEVAYGQKKIFYDFLNENWLDMRFKWFLKVFNEEFYSDKIYLSGVRVIQFRCPSELSEWFCSSDNQIFFCHNLFKSVWNAWKTILNTKFEEKHFMSVCHL